MKVTGFTPSDRFDYVAGVKEGWTRQIAFVKDADPPGPNHFVICDSLSVPTLATWRLWMTASKVTPNGQSALIEGKEDVDMDIFFALPAQVPLKTEEITRKVGCGMNPEGNPVPMSSTQIGLIASCEKTQGFTTALYPRLKTEKPPVFTSLADGKVVKLQSAAGTDYVFLNG